MLSQSSIKQVQALLVELTNKQAFLDTLQSIDDKEGPAITFTVLKTSIAFTGSKNKETYKALIQSLTDATQKDIEQLVGTISELLKS